VPGLGAYSAHAHLTAVLVMTPGHAPSTGFAGAINAEPFVVEELFVVSNRKIGTWAPAAARSH
jgi:hypothetical protein